MSVNAAANAAIAATAASAASGTPKAPISKTADRAALDPVERDRADVQALLDVLPARLFEGPVERVENDGQVLLRAEGGRDIDRHALEQAFYRAYNNPGEHGGRFIRPIRDQAAVNRFVASLAAANTSRWSWVPNVRFVRAEKDHIIVEAGSGVQRRVNPLVYDGPDGNGLGRLVESGERREGQPSWYFALGEDGIDSAMKDIVRVYWAISPLGAPAFIHELTKQLNKNRIPFHSKVCRDPTHYGRADAGVLYLPGYVWDRASAIVADIHASIEGHLLPWTPRFTKPLARGLAFAEDPGDGESFGTSRAAVVLDAVLEAIDEGIDRDGLLDEVIVRMERDGYKMGRLHVKPETRRDYSLDDYYHPRRALAALGGGA